MAPSPSLMVTAIVVIAFFSESVAAVSLVGRRREITSCSCECCEVGRRREEEQSDEAATKSGIDNDHFECALSQMPAYTSDAPRCDNLCRQDTSKSLFAAVEVSEVDTQRFCFSACEPSPSRHKALKPGDVCKPRSKAEKKEVRDHSGNAKGPIETGAKSNFLASHSQSHPQVMSAVITRSKVVGGNARLADVAKPWASVGEPILEQSAKVAEWATEARKNADEAGAEAKKVEEMSTKAGGTMASVMGKVGAAKEAMERTLEMEQKMNALRNALFQKARAAAEQEIPKIVGEIKAAADKKAESAARKKAKVFEKAMKAKANKESAKAAKVYTDVMNGAGKTAAQYAKLGDTLIGQSATMQMNAGLAQGAANQYITIGDMAEGQKLLQQSRGDMDVALSLNGQATGMYDKATQIGGQLGVFAGQAAMAAFHARVMYDPDAVPPPPPLVLAQRQQRHLKRSFLK